MNTRIADQATALPREARGESRAGESRWPLTRTALGLRDLGRFRHPSLNRGLNESDAMGGRVGKDLRAAAVYPKFLRVMKKMWIVDQWA